MHWATLLSTGVEVYRSRTVEGVANVSLAAFRQFWKELE